MPCAVQHLCMFLKQQSIASRQCRANMQMCRYFECRCLGYGKASTEDENVGQLLQALWAEAKHEASRDLQPAQLIGQSRYCIVRWDTTTALVCRGLPIGDSRAPTANPYPKHARTARCVSQRARHSQSPRHLAVVTLSQSRLLASLPPPPFVGAQWADTWAVCRRQPRSCISTSVSSVPAL